jgi:hypothetical protein
MPDMDNATGPQLHPRDWGRGSARASSGKTYIKHNLFINYSDEKLVPSLGLEP